MRAWRAIILAVALIGAAAAAPPPPGCAAHLGAVACYDAEVARLYTAWAPREDAAARRDRPRFEGALRACRAGPAPVACAEERLWSRLHLLAEAQSAGAYTGRWVNDDGVVDILEAADGLARVAIRTTRGRHGYQCRLTRDEVWRSNQSLAWSGDLVRGQPKSRCSLSLRRTGDRLIVEGEDKCHWACGREGEYRGSYRLAR